MLRSLLVPQVDVFSYGAVLFFMLSNSKVLFPLTRAVTHDVPMSLMQWCRQHSALLGLTSRPNNAVRKQLGEELLSVYMTSFVKFVHALGGRQFSIYAILQPQSGSGQRSAC